MVKLKTFYKIKVIILTTGCNVHVDIMPESLPHKVKVDSRVYNVKLEALWKVKHTFLKRPLYFLLGIKGRYLCLFRKGESEPITNIDIKATPILIRNVKKSRILGRALAEIFKVKFSGMGRFIIIIIAMAAILFIAWQQGMIG